MKKVLIVESKVADARALKECLREAGFANPSATLKSGTEAQRHLADRDQDCIVLLNISQAPDGDGMEFLDWIHSQSYYKDLLVIAVGERSQLRAVVEACERGAHTFLIKPVHAEDLKTLAGRYPDHWARARE
ncbi:MAG TPA: response regulator [Verrucomicrobiae bacterium]|nr:response regulator [Verrucomicrobiae bacterium]